MELRRLNILLGQSHADKYGVSSNAIREAVKLLKDEGYEIVSFTNSGYIPGITFKNSEKSI